MRSRQIAPDGTIIDECESLLKLGGVKYENVEKNKDTNTLPYILLGPNLDENKTPIQKLYLKAPLELGELTKMIMMDI